MKRLLVAALLLSSCANEKQLEATLARLETEMWRKKEKAQGLNALRRELEGLEVKLLEARKALPEGRELVAAKAEPAPPHAPAVLPESSIFEGSKGKRLRAQIADTEARILELERVLGEVNALEARRLEVHRQLALLEARQIAGEMNPASLSDAGQ